VFRFRAAALLALTLFQNACGAGWRRPLELTPGPWPPRQQAQVWVSRRALQWHAVRVDPDSISGVPFIAAPSCDSCRVSVPLGTVDSVRVGNPERGLWGTIGLTLAGLLAVALIACAAGSVCQLQAD
jgi:hypothetical protein